MKQLLQNLHTGETQVWDVPAPLPGPNDIIVRNRASVISAGTERMVLEFSRRGLLGKARLRPDLVRDVMAKVRRDGLLSTLHAVRTRLDQPIALGYSCAGVVIAKGAGVTEFQVGDRVACAGGGFALHAEAARIPRMLAVPIPNADEQLGRMALSFEEAAFATIGCVALHGLRLASPQLGETIAVIGLGVVGLLAAQLAGATGCQVIATDLDESRCKVARRLGCNRATSTAEEFERLVEQTTCGLGADAVLIAAAAENSQPLELAARVARDRACIVSIGATGTAVPRAAFYQKELQYKISRSYGPGRYDSQYEEQGHDYPEGYVRWTEGRNLQAFLELLSRGAVSTAPLISHRFPISCAKDAYELLSQENQEPSLGIVIEYPGEHELSPRLSLRYTDPVRRNTATAVRVGLLGAGNYVKSTMLPSIRSVQRSDLVAVCAASGSSAVHVASKYGFQFATTDPSEIIHHSQINTVVIATRHHLHAAQVVAALDAGKHVFCEKPLCLNEGELQEIIDAYHRASQQSQPILMVGFNRRFAPLATKLKDFFNPIQEPLVMNYRVNAEAVADSHWIHDPAQGGGRIIGEVCHFVDLMTFLCGSEPDHVVAMATPKIGKQPSENTCLQITFRNGSVGAITYTSRGDRAFSKERLEVLGGGRVAVLDDFRSLELFSNGRRCKERSFLRSDKGHRSAWQAMVRAVLLGEASPIALQEIVSTSKATFRMMDSVRSGRVETMKSDPTEIL